MREYLKTGLMIVVVLAISCAGKVDIEKAGLSMISEKNLTEHIKFISDDLTEGRDTGSRGERIASLYIATQFALNGVQPAGENGTYFQAVHLIQSTPGPVKEFTFIKGRKRAALKQDADYIAFARNQQKETALNKEIVFAGYGIEAPEYQWNDFKDVDVSGKIVIMLMGEPSSDDSTFFEGKKATQYAGFQYKIEEAEKRNAEGLILIYDKESFRYPWNMITRSVAHPRMETKKMDVKNSGLFSMLSEPGADKLCRLAGTTAAEWKKKASQREFQPVEPGISLKADLTAEIKDIESRNVVGMVEGKRADEYILYSAHTDHLGIGRPDETGDNIYNGAIDDASGCASLIELGRVFANLPEKPGRSILLLCVTGEEKGLLGSSYYAQNPLYPLNKTLAAFSLDVFLPWGKTSDFILLGDDRSTFGDLAREIAADDGMTLSPDPMPEQNFFMRSDHYSYAKVGVPAGLLINGLKYVGKPDDWGLKEFTRWLREDYHHPHEEYSTGWKMETMTEMVKIAYQFGCRIGSNPVWPAWHDDQPFKKTREESMKTQEAAKHE